MIFTTYINVYIYTGRIMISTAYTYTIYTQHYTVYTQHIHTYIEEGQLELLDPKFHRKDQIVTIIVLTNRPLLSRFHIGGNRD